MAQFITGKGDITNPASWQDVASPFAVPPKEYQNVPNNQNYPLNGDGRYWWSGNASVPGENYSLLLHFDNIGTPGTFLDSSPNNLTFAGATGGALQTQVNTPAKFGAAVGSFFTHAGFVTDAIRTPIAANGPLDLHASDFTIDCWVNIPSLSAITIANPHSVFFQDDWQVNSSNPLPTGVNCTINTGGAVQFQVQLNGALSQYFYMAGGTITQNVWHHLAITRQGTTYYTFLDGVLQTTTVDARQMHTVSGTGYLYVGALFNSSTDALDGYMDEFRILKGVAAWTASFTPPTAPYAVVTASAIKFIGDATLQVTGTMALEWQITQYSTDGSIPYLQYSLDGGVTFTNVALGGGQAPQSGSINVTLAANTGIQLGVVFLGGAPVVGAVSTYVAVDITRNVNTTPEYNYPDTFNPTNYNASRLDLSGFPSATLAALRQRMLIGLGFAAQAANPPPSMAAFCNDKLLGAQNFLYRRYPALHTRRFFRWQIVPGQRFYSLKDNDEDVLSTYHMDPLKTIEWAGIQDTRNVWYPMIEGIPPQLYTMISKPWRPARYDIRQAIEIYPAPDQTYWLWIRANFGLLSFTGDSDTTTLDSELVFLEALALAKAHYGQPDAQNYAQMANTYRGELIAGTHKTAHYIPGTIAVPPAVRPTLIQFSDGQSG